MKVYTTGESSHSPIMSTDTESRLTSLVADYILMIFIIVTFLVSACVTGFVCFVFGKKSQLLTVSNGFVLNLICAVLAFTFIVGSFSLTSLIFDAWIFDDVLCRIQGYLVVATMTTIQWSVTVIALDRIFAINHPLRYAGIFSKSVGAVMVCVTWLIGLVIAFPALLGWSSYAYNTRLYMCTPAFGVDRWYALFVLFLVFLIPIVVVGVCYFCVFKSALSHTRRAVRVWPIQQSATTSTATTTTNTRYQDGGPEEPGISDGGAVNVSPSVTNKQSNRHRKGGNFKTVKTVAYIVFGYIVCWFPFIAVLICQMANIDVPQSLGKFTLAALMTSGIVKPTVYVIMNRASRKGLIKCLQTCMPNTFRSGNTDVPDVRISAVTSNIRNSINIVSSEPQNDDNIIQQIMKDYHVTTDYMSPIQEEADSELCRETVFRIHPYIFRKRSESHCNSPQKQTEFDGDPFCGSDASSHVTGDPEHAVVRNLCENDENEATIRPNQFPLCCRSDESPLRAGDRAFTDRPPSGSNPPHWAYPRRSGVPSMIPSDSESDRETVSKQVDRKRSERFSGSINRKTPEFHLQHPFAASGDNLL